MKLLYIILDGLGDLPIKCLRNKTPLEAASKPNLDKLSGKSKLGLMAVISPDIAPESDEAMLALLGFDPFAYHTGRGPLEAFGADVKFEKGDVVLRANFAELDKDRTIKNIESVPTKKDLESLKKIKVPNVKFIHTIGHRGVLILKGNLSPKITNTHPGYKIVRNFVTTALPIKNRKLFPLKCKALEKSAVETAKLVTEFVTASKKILKNKIILTRGAGNKLPNLPKLVGRWALLADMPVEKAIGKLCGMNVLEKPMDYGALADVVIGNLNKFDNFYFEIKGPDKCAHQGDAKGKKKAIEKIDSEFFSKLLKNLDLSQTIICITGDHSTPCELKAHSADPVPVLLYVPGEKGDSLKFGESFAARGSLGNINGTRLFSLLQKLLLFDEGV